MWLAPASVFARQRFGDWSACPAGLAVLRLPCRYQRGDGAQSEIGSLSSLRRPTEALAKFTEVVQASLDAFSSGSSTASSNGSASFDAAAAPTSAAASDAASNGAGASSDPLAQQPAAQTKAAGAAPTNKQEAARHALAAAVAQDVLAADQPAAAEQATAAEAPAVPAVPAVASQADAAQEAAEEAAAAGKGGKGSTVVLPAKAEAAVSCSASEYQLPVQLELSAHVPVGLHGRGVGHRFLNAWLSQARRLLSAAAPCSLTIHYSPPSHAQVSEIIDAAAAADAPPSSPTTGGSGGSSGPSLKVGTLLLAAAGHATGLRPDSWAGQLVQPSPASGGPAVAACTVCIVYAAAALQSQPALACPLML